MSRLKRSLSPFTPFQEPMPFADAFERVWSHEFGPVAEPPKSLTAFDDRRGVPFFFRKIWEAPANEAPELDQLCRYLARFRMDLEQHGLADAAFSAMTQLFDRKTELFLIDHWDESQCKKMGWDLSYRDMVLFSKERDILLGSYFIPMTEKEPGRFAEFITRWVETENVDRLLHFLDFCAGSADPTFEHYLIFTHPALNRLLTNKSRLKALWEKTEPVLKKLSSPTWERDIRKALGVSS